MKSIITLSLVLLICQQSMAQIDTKLIQNDTVFNLNDTINIDNSNYQQAAFIDFENDGSLELVKFYSDNTQFLIRCKMDSGMVLDTIPLPFLANATLQFEDVDYQNGEDIIMYNENSFFVLSNQSTLDTVAFEVSDSVNVDVTINQLEIADLDLDGKKEFVISGSYANEPGLYAFEKEMATWQVVRLDDMADHMEISRWKEEVEPRVFSFRDDSLFVITNTPDSIQVDTVLSFEGTIKHTSIADLDENQRMDMVLSMEGASSGIYILYDDLSLELVDASVGDHVFPSDLNSDGFTDILIQAGNDIIYLENNGLSFEDKAIDLTGTDIIPGDFDYDGDLDFAIIQTDSDLIYVNGSPLNLPPVFPTEFLAFPLGDKVVLSWIESIDDHTTSITYDLNLWRTPSEDLVVTGPHTHNYARSKVAHGNIGFNEVTELRDLEVGAYEFILAPVDNSYYGGVLPGNGLLEPGRFIICEDPQVTSVATCPGDEESFTIGESAHWYSANQGYLGLMDTLHFFVVAEQDTIVAARGEVNACADYFVWEIDLLENQGVYEQMVLCEGASVDIDYREKLLLFDSLQWETDQGLSGSTEVINFIANSDTELYVERFIGQCNALDTITIQISTPVPDLSPTQATIQAGESVEVSHDPLFIYSWNPNVGIVNQGVGFTVLSPVQSTTYVVNVEDSLGCTVQETVEITVNQIAFLPELFTPNGDGSNDQLRLLGLSFADRFKFAIRDKRGNTVYETSDVEEIAFIGWNGDNDGSPVPNGTYFWSVRGFNEFGDRLLVNGKESGIINLVR